MTAYTQTEKTREIFDDLTDSIQRTVKLDPRFEGVDDTFIDVIKSGSGTMSQHPATLDHKAFKTYDVGYSNDPDHNLYSASSGSDGRYGKK